MVEIPSNKITTHSSSLEKCLGMQLRNEYWCFANSVHLFSITSKTRLMRLAALGLCASSKREKNERL